MLGRYYSKVFVSYLFVVLVVLVVVLSFILLSILESRRSIQFISFNYIILNFLKFIYSFLNCVKFMNINYIFIYLNVYKINIY